LIELSKPLCVDCDGTLVKTDLLHEAVFLLFKVSLVSLVMLPIWLFKGKAYLKHRIALLVEPDYGSLPYNSDVLALIKTAKEEGRKVLLVTASPARWANGIAQHLGLFDQVLASSEEMNLAGEAKELALVRMFGKGQFDYVGDSSSDLKVWRSSRQSIVVGRKSRMFRSVEKISDNVLLLNGSIPSVRLFSKAIRIHQWLKNLLVLLPLGVSHQWLNPEKLTNSVLAFFAFCACASSIYVLNDLLDLEADRRHKKKSLRPFAAGLMSIGTGLWLITGLLMIALLIALTLPWEFALTLGVYVFATTIYSVRLKRQIVLDVMILAGLYSVRIIAGAAAVSVVPSFWLLAFSMFIFLSLAILKRYIELVPLVGKNEFAVAGRGYLASDLPVLLASGVSSGICSVLVLALYLNDPSTVLNYPKIYWLWLIPPIILYWVFRVWMKANRGEVDDDPVLFAAKDYQSRWIAAVVLLLAVLGSGKI
jgi:4-hydroxybenzoate polyprenyltransferase/phosphoserine phosphatase